MNAAYLEFSNEKGVDTRVLMTYARAETYKRTAEDVLKSEGNATLYIISDLPDKLGEFDAVALGSEYLSKHTCTIKDSL